jgi:hypothetical protein
MSSLIEGTQKLVEQLFCYQVRHMISREHTSVYVSIRQHTQKLVEQLFCYQVRRIPDLQSVTASQHYLIYYCFST